MLLLWKHVDECLKLEDSFESQAATRARLEREDRENERRMMECERRMVNMRKADRREQVEILLEIYSTASSLHFSQRGFLHTDVMLG